MKKREGAKHTVPIYLYVYGIRIQYIDVYIETQASETRAAIYNTTCQERACVDFIGNITGVNFTRMVGVREASHRKATAML